MTSAHLTFPPLAAYDRLDHAFTLRPAGPLIRDAAAALSTLPPFSEFPRVEAEQVHGCGVAVVRDGTESPVMGVDALITQQTDVAIIIRVADCGPLFIYDPEHHACGLAHSGRKGTELNILNATVSAMAQNFDSRAEDLVVQLGPCIRPPNYEIDFAATLAEQASELGLNHYHDCRENTATSPDRFYSYRMEKGKTGRHYAVIALR